VLGGALWIGSLLLAGYSLGNVDIIAKHVDLVCIGIIGLSVLPIIATMIKNKLNKN
jgi:membrane-associated protein